MTMDDEVITNVPASLVRSVDFEHGHVTAILETKSEGIKGKLWMVDGQKFHIEGPDGATLRIPFANVLTGSFAYAAAPPDTRVAVKKMPAVVPVVEELKRRAEEPDISTITHGDRVNVPQQLAHGKVTIVDFYAMWCGPCRELAPVLDRMAREDADVAIRKVDIVRWGSPVADQYNIKAVPWLQVYGADGALVRTLGGFRESDLQEAIAKAKASLR